MVIRYSFVRSSVIDGTIQRCVPVLHGLSRDSAGASRTAAMVSTF